MGKCFLGLWGGVLLALSFAVSELSGPRASLRHCISGALEWIYVGIFLTVFAVFGYGICQWWEKRRSR